MSLPSFVYGPGPAPGYGRPAIDGLEMGSPHHQRHFSHEHHLGSGPSSPAPAHLYPGPPPHLEHLQQHSPPHSQPFPPAQSGMLPRMGVFHEPAPVQGAVVVERATRRGRRGGARKQAGAQRGAPPIIPSPPLVPPAAGPSTAARKPASRDSKRRATHSQIERRRREKINDRLITLRNLVPACAREVEERKRKAAGLDADGTPLEATIGEDGKRKRVRRKNVPQPKEDANGEEELGLHKLEVLTHAIDYIYELQAKIEELQTGTKPALLRRASDADRDRDKAEAAASLQDTATPTVATQAAAEEDEEDELEMDDWKGVRPSSKGQEHAEAPLAWDPRPPTSSSSQGRFSISSGSALPARAASSPSPPSSVLPLKADPMVSSFRASRRSSPSVMSLTADSPMLSPFAGALLAHSSLTMPSPLTVPTVAPGSSGSAFTQLTSPVMSMGAESPIFKASGATSGGADGGGPSSSAGPSGSRRASIISKQAWPMLPSSALPLPTSNNGGGPSIARKRDSVASSSNGTDAKRVKREAGQDSPPENNSSSSTGSASNASAQAPPAQSDAELLLSFSTSPEALRPLSAVRESFPSAGPPAPTGTVSRVGRRSDVSPREGSSRSTAGGGAGLDGPALRRSRGGSLELPMSAARAAEGTAASVAPSSSAASATKPSSAAAEEAKDKTLTKSAPGGAWPTTTGGSLNSPPHLRLDSTSASSRNGVAGSSDDADSGCKPEAEARNIPESAGDEDDDSA